MSGPEATEHLHSVRDWLRYATSRFNAAHLVYGHGTSTAIDEAAFLILHTLHLPIDQLDPWLDARLLPAERVALLDIIEGALRRASRRRTSPTRRGSGARIPCRRACYRASLADRGLLGGGLAGVITDPTQVGASSGFVHRLGLPGHSRRAGIRQCDCGGQRPLRRCTRRGQTQRGRLRPGGRITLSRGDLFAAHAGRTLEPALANPPYVADARAWLPFRPEYAAEPAMAHAGGADGLDIVRRILAQAGRYLTTDGRLVVEIGTGRGRLEQDFPDLPFLWLDTEESQGEVFALDGASLAGADRG
jgi:ribosomal protein L3 glutamine methyltransferase